MKTLLTEIRRLKTLMEVKETELKVQFRQGVDFRDITTLPETPRIDTFTGEETGTLVPDPQLTNGEVRAILDDGRIVITTEDAVESFENVLDLQSKEEYVNNDGGGSGIAMFEGVPDKDLTEVTVLYRGDEDKLEELLDHIRAIGNTGHSFEILVDPDGDKDEKKTFYWDGDGANYIKEIRVNGELYKGVSRD